MNNSVINPIFTIHCITITNNSKKIIKETTYCKYITLMFIYYGLKQKYITLADSGFPQDVAANPPGGAT